MIYILNGGEVFLHIPDNFYYHETHHFFKEKRRKKTFWEIWSIYI